MTDTMDTVTAAAVVERQKLQRHFGRFDILKVIGNLTRVDFRES